MSLDQRLFGWIYRTLKSTPESVPVEGAQLTDLLERLEILAGAVAGLPLSLRPAESFGGVRGRTLLLPASMSLFPEAELNLAAYVYRVAYSATSFGLGFTTDGFPSFPDSDRLGSLIAIPATRVRLREDLPGTDKLLETLLSSLDAPHLFTDGFLKSLLAVDGSLALGPTLLGNAPSQPAELAQFMVKHRGLLEAKAADICRSVDPLLSLVGVLRPQSTDQSTPASAFGDNGNAPGGEGSEFEAPQRDDVDVIELGASNEDENPMVHSFEKVHTADDYKGGSKRHDGEDELDEQLAALDELDLSQVVRTGEPAQSVLKLEGLFEGFAGDATDGTESRRPCFLYDEWDAQKRLYRKDWCRLYVERPPEAIASELADERIARARRENARQLREMKALLESLEMERRWVNRQLDGTELDIDAWVDGRARFLSGGTPSNRIYARRRRRDREMATLVLLDLSSSCDAWIDNQRVLDVAKDALIVLGDTLSQASDRFAVAGFQSHTRQDCRFLPIKSFEDPWQSAILRMLSVRPAGYTRIGPALRHGVRLLSEHPARKRLLLLVTDGKPTDYDRYEGRYGVSDVRQAFREAEEEQVFPFAVTIAETARSTLPRMFGRGKFEVISTAGDLADALASVYARLAG